MRKPAKGDDDRHLKFCFLDHLLILIIVFYVHETGSLRNQQMFSNSSTATSSPKVMVGMFGGVFSHCP